MKNRVVSFIVIKLIYIAAIAAGIMVASFMPKGHVFAVMAAAYFAATAVVFIASLFFKNASVYDPYWSVMPVFLILGFYWYEDIRFYAHHLVVLLPFLFWAVRLTYNWARGFENMEWEDWRYRKFRANHPKIFPLISFAGIMLMPGVLTYLGTMPMLFVISSAKFSTWHTAGGVIILFAAIYQTTADEQMRKFRRENKGKGLCIDGGLWRLSRHPNYFGEILIWWGVAAAGVAKVIEIGNPNKFLSYVPDGMGALRGMPALAWILCFAGAMAITLLFIFISIPLMEKNILSTRPQYAEYKKRVRTMMVPWWRKNAGTGLQDSQETKND